MTCCRSHFQFQSKASQHTGELSPGRSSPVFLVSTVHLLPWSASVCESAFEQGRVRGRGTRVPGQRQQQHTFAFLSAADGGARPRRPGRRRCYPLHVGPVAAAVACLPLHVVPSVGPSHSLVGAAAGQLHGTCSPFLRTILDLLLLLAIACLLLLNLDLMLLAPGPAAQHRTCCK